MKIVRISVNHFSQVTIVSRLPREMMANCAMYVCKDNPDSQPPHNCNHIANLNSVLILEIRLESCRNFVRRDMRKERTSYQKECLLPLPVACPMQCFCCTLSPTTTLLPGAVTLCYITLPQQCCNQAELASLSHLKHHVIHTQSDIA